MRDAWPAALIFSRQTLPHQDRAEDGVKAIERGGYTLISETVELDAIIIATGSEVGIAVAAAQTLAEKGRGIRVV